MERTRMYLRGSRKLLWLTAICMGILGTYFLLSDGNANNNPKRSPDAEVVLAVFNGSEANSAKHLVNMQIELQCRGRSWRVHISGSYFDTFDIGLINQASDYRLVFEFEKDTLAIKEVKGGELQKREPSGVLVNVERGKPFSLDILQMDGVFLVFLGSWNVANYAPQELILSSLVFSLLVVSPTSSSSQEHGSIAAAGGRQSFVHRIEVVEITPGPFLPKLISSAYPRRQPPIIVGKEYLLFIGVMSSVENKDLRNGLRSSWMRHRAFSDELAALRFFVGYQTGDQSRNSPLWNEVRKEMETYDDIVLVDFEENYYKIGFKTLEILKFGFRNIAARYIMKCDDDTFVDMNLLIPELQKRVAKSQVAGIYLGSQHSFAEPIRDVNHRFYMSVKEYSNRWYAPFASGEGYLVTPDVAHSIVEAVRNNEVPMFRFEDVSVGYWIDYLKHNKTLDIDIIHERRFHVEQYQCCLENILMHKISPRDMACIFVKRSLYLANYCCWA